MNESMNGEMNTEQCEDYPQEGILTCFESTACQPLRGFLSIVTSNPTALWQRGLDIRLIDVKKLGLRKVKQQA